MEHAGEGSGYFEASVQKYKWCSSSSVTSNMETTWILVNVLCDYWAGSSCSSHLQCPNLASEEVRNKDADFCQAGIEAELLAHKKNQTCKFVPRAEGKRILTSKRIFKMRCSTGFSGGVETPKAKLVVRTFQEVSGLDYRKTYVPIVKFTSIPSLLVGVAHLGVELH